jgi:hypothetical protein
VHRHDDPTRVEHRRCRYARKGAALRITSRRLPGYPGELPFPQVPSYRPATPPRRAWRETAQKPGRQPSERRSVLSARPFGQPLRRCHGTGGAIRPAAYRRRVSPGPSAGGRGRAGSGSCAVRRRFCRAGRPRRRAPRRLMRIGVLCRYECGGLGRAVWMRIGARHNQSRSRKQAARRCDRAIGARSRTSGRSTETGSAHARLLSSCSRRCWPRYRSRGSSTAQSRRPG